MTSRLSYTSAAESDGEFCNDELSPRRAGTLKQDPSGRLVRVASDPSLARQDGTIRGQDGTMKSEHGDYSLPPPYTAAAPQQPETTKRRSHGGDSKYGFPNGNKSSSNGVEESPSGYSTGMYRDSRERQSNDRYQAPVEAGNSGTTSGKNKKDIGSLPVLPPKIDRQKKPSKKSAAERLFGRSSSSNNSNNNAINNVTNGKTGKTGDDDSPVNGEASDESPPDTRGSTGGFHSMPPSVSENNKKNTFDSNSSSNFDSYNKHAAA